METETKLAAPTSIFDVKFGMTFQASGEGAFMYKVNAIETGRDPAVYLQRIHDGNLVKVMADRLFVMLKSRNLVFIK